MNLCYLANAGSVHTRRWAEHFARTGHRVTVISFEPGRIEGATVLIPSFLLPSGCSRRLRMVSAIPSIRSLVRKLRPDILHAHYLTSYGLAAAFCSFRPTIVTAWGTDLLLMPLRSQLYDRIVRTVLKRADYVTVLAPHMKKFIAARGYATKESIATIPIGVDHTLFTPREPSQHKSGPITVLSTRRLEYELHLDLLIKAVPEVLNCHPETKFIFAGDGPFRHALRELATQLNIQDAVSFVGNQTTESVANLLRSADIYVSTSPSDGNSVSLNEAMASGIFPIVTDIPANREYLTCESQRLLFAVADSSALASAIVNAISNPALRQAAAAKNRAIVERELSWASATTQLDALYQRAARRTPYV